MGYSLTLAERETSINYDMSSPLATLFTSNQREITRLLTLATKNDQMRVISQMEDSLMVEFPKRWVKINLPRVLTEEQKAANIARLAGYRSAKQD